MSKDGSAMAGRPRYRRISTRIWGDERVRQLSEPAPNGRTLWFFLLTGPFTRAIPGLIPVGERAMAERLGWPLPAFQSAWREIEAAGMARADWDNGLVYIPKAIRHTPPDNPNQVIGWRYILEEAPECALLSEALRDLREYCRHMGDGFLKAFDDVFGKALSGMKPPPKGQRDRQRNPPRQPGANRSTNGGRNKEQEQEQEQDRDQEQEQDQEPPAGVVQTPGPLSVVTKGHAADRAATTPTRDAFDRYFQRFSDRSHAKPALDRHKDGARMQRLLLDIQLTGVYARLDAFFDPRGDPFWSKCRHTLDCFFAAGTQTKLAAAVSGTPESTLSDTMRHNMAAAEEVQRMYGVDELARKS